MSSERQVLAIDIAYSNQYISDTNTVFEPIQNTSVEYTQYSNLNATVQSAHKQLCISSSTLEKLTATQPTPKRVYGRSTQHNV